MSALTLTGWLRFDLVDRVIRGLSPLTDVLEIGAGSGALGARLAARYRYTGVEPDPTSAAVAQRRVRREGGTVLHGSIDDLKPHQQFDLVCAFEVLEHIQDDVGALRAWTNRIRPGGAMVLSVPAFTKRFGPWDVRAGHYRRYEPQQLLHCLQVAGLQIGGLWAYGFPLGNLLEAARHRIVGSGWSGRRMEDRTAQSGRALQPPDQFGWATAVLSYPFRLLQRPFHGRQRGIGLVALAGHGIGGGGQTATSRFVKLRNLSGLH